MKRKQPGSDVSGDAAFVLGKAVECPANAQ
jgi:hypothetical protein